MNPSPFLKEEAWVMYMANDDTVYNKSTVEIPVIFKMALVMEPKKLITLFAQNFVQYTVEELYCWEAPSSVLR